MDVRYNYFIETDWDRILYNAKVMNFAKDKKFLRKLIFSGRVSTQQTIIPKFSVEHIGSHKNRFRLTYYNRLCDYIDTYQNKFGDDWDIHFQKDPEIYGEGQEYYRIYLFKIFDKVEVKKYSNNTSHTIHDLAVFNTIGMKDDGEFWIPRMQGLRLSFSNKEILTGYIHSHLKANKSLQRNPCQLGDFCIGADSDTMMLSGMLATEFSKEQFEVYLYAQDSTIECESNIGTPHIRFSQLLETANIGSINISIVDTYDRYSRELLFSGEPIDVDYYISDNNYHIKNNDIFHSFIKKRIIAVSNRWQRYLCKKGENGAYYSYETLNDAIDSPIPLTISTSNGKPPYIYYQGVKKEFKIQKQRIEKKDKLKIEEFIVYPNLLNYIHEQLEHKLQQAAIAGSNIYRHYSSNNVSRYLR